MDINRVIDNKLFWTTMYLFLTKKNVSKNSKITLAEKDEIVTDDSKIADTFNTLFCNIVETLNIEQNEFIISEAKVDIKVR